MNYIHLVYIIFLFEMFTPNQALDMSEQLKSYAQKLHRMCQKETGIPEELIKSGTVDNIPTDRILQCYIHCLFDKVGLIDDKLVIHLEYLFDVLPTELHSILQALMDACGTQIGADGCETAFLTTKCYIASNPEFFKSTINFVFD